MNKSLSIIGISLTCLGAMLFWPEVHHRGELIKATTNKEVWKTRIGGVFILTGSLFQIIATFV